MVVLWKISYWYLYYCCFILVLEAHFRQLNVENNFVVIQLKDPNGHLQSRGYFSCHFPMVQVRYFYNFIPSSTTNFFKTNACGVGRLYWRWRKFGEIQLYDIELGCERRCTTCVEDYYWPTYGVEYNGKISMQNKLLTKCICTKGFE